MVQSGRITMNLTVTRWCWAESELFVDQRLGVNKVLNPTASPNVDQRDGNSETFRHTFTLSYRYHHYHHSANDGNP